MKAPEEVFPSFQTKLPPPSYPTQSISLSAKVIRLSVELPHHLSRSIPIIVTHCVRLKIIIRRT